MKSTTTVERFFGGGKMEKKGTKLFNSELRVMNLLWENGPMSASEIANELTDWKRNTTYTVIKKCITKNAISRKDPGFICTPLLKKEDVQEQETTELIDKMFDSSDEKFLAAFISKRKFTSVQIEKLKKLIEED